MAAVTFAEAARRLGHRSRSTLYRLKAETRLDHYLVDGPNGSQLLELAPPDRPTLEAYLGAVLDPGRGPQARRREQRSQRDRRWELVATTLSAALEVIGGPSLTAKEAELLADRMGPATWETFPEGLPQKSQEDSGWVMAQLWNPMAAEVNQDLVAHGWRLPPLSGQELQLVAGSVDAWEEGTVWDTESPAWWRMTLEDTREEDPTDPSPDPWRCEWCGKPWHPSHPDHENTPQREVWREALLARLGTSTDIPEEASQELEKPDLPET